MSQSLQAFEDAVAAHDATVSARGVDVWVGGEPTFTDRRSASAEWNGDALGDDKRARAERVVAAMAAAHPGCALVRTVGKQYPGEDLPRWSYGVYGRRDGGAVWSGPPDPIAGGGAGTDADARRFRDALARLVDGQCIDVDAPLPYRVVTGDIDLAHPELARSPIAADAIPDSGPCDDLAERDVFLYAIGVDADAGGAVRIDLPAIIDVARFERWLDRVAAAAAEAGLGGLVLGGFPPPVDESIWLATVTPDPGVLEINGAPEPSVTGYYRQLCRVYDLAREVSLEPERLYFNGDLAESGGGGHITFGGPSPLASPFFRSPMLLARMLAYTNRHPALSYLFAPDCVGSSSQSPRPDEVARESFGELAVALDAFGRLQDPSPVDVWSAFAPFLADRFGNTHRIETNVEKLWNPYFPLRGRLGVVELRAMRMPPTPERAASVAALMRAVLAYLATTETDLELVDWGAELHDRFALPHFQIGDLDVVLAELAVAGLGLPAALIGELRNHADLTCGTVDLGHGRTLTVRWAREFWPIVGDGSRPDQTSRTMDASCARIELTVTGGADIDLAVAGRRVPWGRDGDTLIRGVRFRRFATSIGLHPHVHPLDPLVIEVGRHRVSLHGWKPDGGAYRGVPADRAEAAARRAERFVVEPVEPGHYAVLQNAPSASLTRFTVDTRRF